MDKPRSPEIPNPQVAMQPVIELIQGGDPKDICARYGITPEELNSRMQSYESARSNMALQDALSFRRVGRNDPCPCGSGKKYKKCCQSKHEDLRKSVSPDVLKEMEDKARLQEQIDSDIKKGFDLLSAQEFKKARSLGERLLESFPEDDRVYDIILVSALGAADYEEAFRISRRRWQVAQEEKAFLQENGFYKRAGSDGNNLVHFYSPSTWLENLWISQRARDYAKLYPQKPDSPLVQKVARLQVANDHRRFSARNEEGYEERRKAVADVLDELEKEGPAAVPYLLPLTYFFSWASLFVPDLLKAYGTDEAIRLLAELSMFRLPYFAQKCLIGLESLGERTVPAIQAVLDEKPAFDELKVGLIMVLGSIRTSESFATLVKMTEHKNDDIANWAAQALANHESPEALPYLEKARERLKAQSKIAAAIHELA